MSNTCRICYLPERDHDGTESHRFVASHIPEQVRSIPHMKPMTMLDCARLAFFRSILKSQDADGAHIGRGYMLEKIEHAYRQVAVRGIRGVLDLQRRAIFDREYASLVREMPVTEETAARIIEENTRRLD